MRKTIEILARGVCVVDGWLLLCHPEKGGYSYLPGGHVEFGEEARGALEREIREELGRPARSGRFLGCVENTFRQGGRLHAEINLCFALRIPGLRPPRPPVSAEGWIGFRWHRLERLAACDLEPAVLRRALPRWLRAGPGHATAS